MISVPELRAHLRLQPSEDFRLEAIRLEVIALWEGATGRLWNQRTDHVQVFDQSLCPTDELMLGLWPVTSVTAVKERAPHETAWRTLEASEYFIFGRRALARQSGSWRERTEVTYSGGVADAQPDVKRALLIQAGFMLERMGSEKVIVKNTFGTAGGATYETADFHPLFDRLARQYGRKS